MPLEAEALATPLLQPGGPAGGLRLDRLRTLRERVAAWLVARDCLLHHDALRSEFPALGRHALYRILVDRQSGLGKRGVDALFVRAGRQMARAGGQPELRLRDVAAALLAQRCRRWPGTHPGRMAHCLDIIAREIPEDL
jgi:hypothetical protein